MPSSPITSFSASYDSTTKVLSAATSVVLLVVVFATHSVVVACLAALVIFLAYAYSPGAYAVKDQSILVNRLIGNVRIPLDDIREVRATTPGDFLGTIRLFGSGGLFGYYGLFRTSNLGKCWWYVTNPKNIVVVITGEKTILISPDCVDGFLTAIQAAVSISTLSTASSPETGRAFRGGGTVGKMIGVVILVLVVALVMFAVTYSPGPPRYTLTPNSLTIHDRLYPATVNASDIDVDSIRLVNIGTDPDWRPVERTNGFANGHYRSGWFRVRTGQKVRMYRADSRVLVLLPPKGNGSAVLLEVRGPEKFMEEVCQRWVRRCK
jgi:hypothetical protein